MERLTGKTPEGAPCSTAELPELLDRLCRFEDVCEALLRTRTETAEELERLRAAGKAKTLRYRELLAARVMNENIISLLAVNGIRL